mgnify:CR=1 FL=1
MIIVILQGWLSAAVEHLFYQLSFEVIRLLQKRNVSIIICSGFDWNLTSEIRLIYGHSPSSLLIWVKDCKKIRIFAITRRHSTFLSFIEYTGCDSRKYQSFSEGNPFCEEETLSSINDLLRCDRTNFIGLIWWCRRRIFVIVLLQTIFLLLLWVFYERS